MGKLSKHHKNGDGELQLISHGKVTGYLWQTFLVPYTMGQAPGWVTQWSSFSQAEGKRTKNSMLGFFQAEGERTKNSMLGFISRGLRNTLSWGLTPIPGWLDIVVFTSMLSSMLWVQKKVPVDNLKLQGQTPLFQ